MSTRMDGCELGAKLALIEGTIISRMAPVNAMVIKIFFIIDSIWSYSNNGLHKDDTAKMMPDSQFKNKTIILNGYKT